MNWWNKKVLKSHPQKSGGWDYRREEMWGGLNCKQEERNRKKKNKYLVTVVAFTVRTCALSSSVKSENVGEKIGGFGFGGISVFHD